MCYDLDRFFEKSSVESMFDYFIHLSIVELHLEGFNFDVEGALSFAVKFNFNFGASWQNVRVQAHFMPCFYW